MQSRARVEAATLAVRPIFDKPSTLELLGRYVAANEALRQATDAEFSEANAADYDAKRALRAHVGAKLNLSAGALALLVEALA